MQRTYPKRRKYSLSCPPYHQNGPSHMRAYNPPIHHNSNPIRLHAHEKGHPRSFDSADCHIQNGENTGSPSSFYYHSPTYQRTNNENHPSHRPHGESHWAGRQQSGDPPYLLTFQSTNSDMRPYGRAPPKQPYWADTVGRKTDNSLPKLTHVSEKRPTRQTKEPFWLEDFEHCEVQSTRGGSQQSVKFAQPPNVQRKLQHPDLQNNSKLSYRFPSQDPPFLKERFKLKRKHQATVTDEASASDNEVKKTSESEESITSPNIRTECAEKANTQGTSNACKKSEGNSENLSKSGATVTTFDSNGNFIVVSKEGSVAKTFVQKEKQNLSRSCLNRFENDQKEDDVQLVSLHVKENAGTAGKDNVKKQQVVHNGVQDNSQLLAVEVEKAKTNGEKIETNLDDSESLSEAESEVFDEIFLKTIHKELANMSEDENCSTNESNVDFDDCEASRTEGSISPTFDSTLLRYLDDTTRSRIENRELSSRADISAKGDGDKNEKVGETQVDERNEEGDVTIVYPKEYNGCLDRSKACVDLTTDDHDAKEGDNVVVRSDSDRPSSKTDNSKSDLQCVDSGKNNTSATPVAVMQVSEEVGDGSVEKKKDAVITEPDIVVEKDAGKLIKSNRHSEECADTNINVDALDKIDKIPLSNRQSHQNLQMKDKLSCAPDFVCSDDIDKSLDDKLTCNVSAPREIANSTGTEVKTSGDILNAEESGTSLGEIRLSDSDKTARTTLSDGKLPNEKSEEMAEKNTDGITLENVKPVTKEFQYPEMIHKTFEETLSSQGESSSENRQNTGLKNTSFSIGSLQNNNAVVAPLLETRAKNYIFADDAIELIRKNCKHMLRKSLKLSNADINKARETEQAVITDEVCKASESNEELNTTITEEDNSSFDASNSSFEDCVSIESGNSLFVPLCEGLLPSVEHELHKKKENINDNGKERGKCQLSSNKNTNSENNEANIALSEDIAFNDDTQRAITKPTESLKNSTYNILHSAAVASKMINSNALNQSCVINEAGPTPTYDITVSKSFNSKIQFVKEQPASDSSCLQLSKAIKVVEEYQQTCEILINEEVKLPNEKTKACKKSDSEDQLCIIDTRVVQAVNAIQPVQKNNIKDPMPTKPSMAQIPEVLGLDKEIIAPKATAEPNLKEDNCKQIVTQDLSIIEESAMKHSGICETLGLEKESLWTERTTKPNCNEMVARDTSTTLDGSVINDLDTSDIHDARKERLPPNEVSSKTNEIDIPIQMSETAPSFDIKDTNNPKSQKCTVEPDVQLEVSKNVIVNELESPLERDVCKTMAAPIEKCNESITAGLKSDLEISNESSDTVEQNDVEHSNDELQIISQGGANPSPNCSTSTMTSHVKENFMEESQVKSQNSSPPEGQATTHGMKPNSVCTDGSKEILNDDSNSRLLPSTNVLFIKDETTHLAQDNEMTDAVNLESLTVAPAEIPLVTKTQMKADKEERSDPCVVNSPAIITMQAETIEAPETQLKDDMETEENLESESSVAFSSKSSADESGALLLDSETPHTSEEKNKSVVEHESNSQSDVPGIVADESICHSSGDGVLLTKTSGEAIVLDEQKKTPTMTVVKEPLQQKYNDFTKFAILEEQQNNDFTELKIPEQQKNNDVIELMSPEPLGNNDLTELKASEEQQNNNLTELNIPEQQRNNDVTELKLPEQQINNDFTKLKIPEQEKNNDSTELKLAEQQRNNDFTELKASEEQQNNNSTELKIPEQQKNIDSTELKLPEEQENNNLTELKVPGQQITNDLPKLSEEQQSNDVTGLKGPEQQRKNDLTESKAHEEQQNSDLTVLKLPEQQINNDLVELKVPEEQQNHDLAWLGQPEQQKNSYLAEFKAPEEQQNNDLTELRLPVEQQNNAFTGLEKDPLVYDFRKYFSENKLDNGQVAANKFKDFTVSNERNLGQGKKHEDTEVTEATAVLSEYLESNKNCSFKHLLINILAKNLEDTTKGDEIQSKDLFQDSPIVHSPSHDSFMTDSEYSSTSFEESFAQNLLTKASQLSDNEHDMSSLESSDVEMVVPEAQDEPSPARNVELTTSHEMPSVYAGTDTSLNLPETNKSNISHNNGFTALKQGGQISCSEIDKNTMQSILSKTRKLTGNLVSTCEGELHASEFKTSSQEPEVETSLRKSSARKRQNIRSSSIFNEQKRVEINSKALCKESVGISKNKREIAENNKEGSEKDPSMNKKDVSLNGTYLCKHSKEALKNNYEVSFNNRELLANKVVSITTKGKVSPEKRCRPPRQSRRISDFQNDVSGKKPKRRSPRQRQRKWTYDEVNDYICGSNLSSRELPYRPNMSRRSNMPSSGKSIGRPENLVKVEKHLRTGGKETFEFDQEQVINILDDVDEFFPPLDVSSEEGSILSELTQGTGSTPSLGSSLPIEESNSPAYDTKVKKVTTSSDIPAENSSTCDVTKLKECSPRSSMPHEIESSLPDSTNISTTGRTSCQTRMENNTQGSSVPNRMPSRRGRRRRGQHFRKKRCVSDSQVCSISTPTLIDSPNEKRNSESTVDEVRLEAGKISGDSAEALNVSISSEMHHPLAGFKESDLSVSISDEVVSKESDLSSSTSGEVHTSLGGSKAIDGSNSLDCSTPDLVPRPADVCSSTPACQLLPSIEGVSSTKMDTQENMILTQSDGSLDAKSGESLKITLISEIDPRTGKTNWTTNYGKPAEVMQEESSTGYGLRPSKARKTKQPSPVPTAPNAKRRRMTITDLRTETHGPPSLRNLAKRSLEECIRSVEKEHRSQHKHPKKGLLSIDMRDHVNKTTTQGQDGDYLKLGDTEVMYEIVRRAYDESMLKRGRSSPRSLYLAAKQGNALQVLVSAAGCHVNATIPQEKHKTAMHAAAAAGHLQVLRLLCMIGGNLSCLDTNLQTPLFDAVENQQAVVVKFLISQDVNLNLKDSQGMTVLHVAAQKSNLDIINLLMNTHKLDVNEQDNGGWTALMWTAEGMRMDVAECLLNWGANVNILDSEQNTCLHWAALAGDTKIMDLLLKSNVHLNARNMFGATALHISARERKLPNIKTLAKYRPNPEIRNSEGKRAIDLVPSNSKCYRELKQIGMLMSMGGPTLKERIISRDISRGQEKRPIPCVNSVDDDDLPGDFVYVSNNLESQSQGFDRSMVGCNCSDGCVTDKHCECAQLSTRKRFWYDESGRINSEIFDEDRPLVYECNMKCKCWSNCRQRVVQRGITAGLQLYKTNNKGWAVRTQALIPKGTFVCEYVGEILTDSDADRREDDCYLFDLDVKGQSTLFCLDAKFYGNITRFINHSCDPNILPVRVFTDHQSKSCPRIAFFAAKDIKPYEEVCSNYGEKFWKVKKSEFHCVCNTSKCKYSANKK